jgi:diguanylate cyclase (GGDEF)-like protein
MTAAQIDHLPDSTGSSHDSTRYALLNDLLNAGWLRFRFPPPLEREFRHYHATGSARTFRSTVFYVLVLYLILGLGIMAIIPSPMLGAWPLGYSAVAVLILAGVILSRQRRLDPWHQHYVTALAFPGMAVLVILPEFTGAPIMRQAATIGSVHAAVVIGSMLGLRTAPAVLAMWGGGYLGVTAVLLAGQSVNWLLTHQTLTAGCGVATIVAWLMERHSRQVFLQQSLISLEKARSDDMAERMKEMSREDALTGLANRRHFDEVLHLEWQRCMRDGASLSLMFIDVDFFKPYNDEYGHQAGDDCLQHLGGILADHARRPGDLAARYGGEEFVVLYPQTGPRSLEQMADKLLRAVADERMPHGHSSVADHITVSIGTACIVPEQSYSPEQLVAAADHAVYEAKNKGRNRVYNAPVRAAD